MSHFILFTIYSPNSIIHELLFVHRVICKHLKKIEKIRQDRAAFTNSTNYEQALGGKKFFIYSITVLERSLVVR